MKKALFILFRTVTVISTLFWSAFCIPIVGFCVGMFCDDVLNMQTWQFVLLISFPSVIGLLTAILFGRQLPKLDPVLSVLLPPAYVGIMYFAIYRLIELTGPEGSLMIPAYILGALCFASGIAASVYYIKNAKRRIAFSDGLM